MRKIYSAILLAAFILAASQVWAADKIKVACVGNSVTYGYKIPDREVNCYPAQLQRMMGEGYDVRNFGRSSATMTHRSPMWYMGLDECRAALSFKPDLVVIHLGLNDTDPRWWPNYSEEFIPDYRALIDSFRVANPKAKIWICLMTPIGHDHHRFQSGTRDWHEQIQGAIRKIAATADVKLIDLFTPLFSHPNLFPDALHPDAEGAGILARTVYQNLTGQYGGLKMAPTYGDHMVLQRDKPLTISGTANAGDKIKVELKGLAKSSATTSDWGQWAVSLPAQPAGGPYTLTITSPDTAITYSDVWMGDVWLCSGQSNMEFRLNQCATWAADQNDAKLQQRIHVLDYKAIAPTSNYEWPQDVLTKVNNLEYLSTTGWQTMPQSNVGSISAIAYHFAKTLTDSLPDLHVGIVCNAVGGSATESWIDRWTLEYEYPQILYNWKQNDHIQQWVRERGAYNIKQAANPLQRHPYEPCYLFESGIQPLGHLALKGTIWYQGESNAHNTELHERLFPLLVGSWRQWFDSPEMPFYFVQLSSLNRPSWPRFRNSQRLMANRLDNVWMAVSSDLGDSLDVHPTRKQAVGQRLALQALRHTYGHSQLLSEGPAPLSAKIQGKEIVITFANATSLKPASGSELIGFEVAGADGLFHAAKAIAQGNTVRIKIDKQSPAPATIRYGWQPFTRANLQNEAALPASTFQMEIQQ